MIYLSGCIVKNRHPKVGFIVTPRRREAAPDDAILAADNGCFTDPAGYSDAGYEAFLKTLPHNRTLFATAPDVLGSHAETVARSVPMLRRIRSLGIASAFVAQDGWDECSTPWSEIDWIFVGGSTAFKFRRGRDAVLAAHRRGKRTHMGRVNSLERLRAAKAIGCDSADGTFLKFGPDVNWPRLVNWFDTIDQQPGLAV